MRACYIYLQRKIRRSICNNKYNRIILGNNFCYFLLTIGTIHLDVSSVPIKCTLRKKSLYQHSHALRMYREHNGRSSDESVGGNFFNTNHYQFEFISRMTRLRDLTLFFCNPCEYVCYHNCERVNVNLPAFLFGVK